jgi:hypothetical protein
MPTIVKKNKKNPTPSNAAQLQKFVEKVKSGKVVPFKEKTEHARKNLKKARLIR